MNLLYFASFGKTELEAPSDRELDVAARFPDVEGNGPHHDLAVEDLGIVGEDQTERSVDHRQHERYFLILNFYSISLPSKIPIVCF